ncbi:MAG: hypothetical protein ACTSR8_01650 [Promethearchaeota archaeon]
MIRRKRVIIAFSVLVISVLFISIIQNSSSANNANFNEIETPKTSATLEDSEKIIVKEINREVNLTRYGLVYIFDNIEFENTGINPVSAVFIGVHNNYSDNLIYFEATGGKKQTLYVERQNLMLNEYEMIAIYFDSALKPQESKTIHFTHAYKDLLNYTGSSTKQLISFKGIVFPALPYRAEGSIKATFLIPESSTLEFSDDWGSISGEKITYNIDGLSVDHLEPLLDNIANKYTIGIIYSDLTISKLEYQEINRNIYISTWGIIQVQEEFLIQNDGVVDVNDLKLKIPGPAKNILVSDDLGEILGVVVDPESNYTHLKYKDLSIDLSENRVTLTPGSKFRFVLEYFLPFEKHFTLDWFRESIRMNLNPTYSDYLGKDETVRIIIDGSYSIDSYSILPDLIEYDEGRIVLIYNSEYLSPLESKLIVITYTIDIFEMLFRPIIFMLIIALLSSVYVIIAKSKKPEEIAGIFRKDMIPTMEIRQFCTLYEEKNALLVEIRDAEDNAKRKKIAKKKLKNIITTNSKKIQEIEQELFPFKEYLIQTNPTFENIVRKLDDLEAERISIKDSLALLETRYKRGRLPSRAAYLKLFDNFIRRQRKVDRSIDKLIQQLRSYLL